MFKVWFGAWPYGVPERGQPRGGIAGTDDRGGEYAAAYPGAAEWLDEVAVLLGCCSTPEKEALATCQSAGDFVPGSSSLYSIFLSRIFFIVPGSSQGLNG